MCDALCQGMGKETVVTDLCVKAADIRLPAIDEDDLAVIAMPVFAGRVPALLHKDGQQAFISPPKST